MFLDLQWHDYIGSLGVFIIVFAYFSLQTGKINGQDINFSLLNIVGSILILITLYFDFNFSATIVEIFWLAISLLGLSIGLKKAQKVLGD